MTTIEGTLVDDVLEASEENYTKITVPESLSFLLPTELNFFSLRNAHCSGGRGGRSELPE